MAVDCGIQNKVITVTTYLVLSGGGVDLYLYNGMLLMLKYRIINSI